MASKQTMSNTEPMRCHHGAPDEVAVGCWRSMLCEGMGHCRKYVDSYIYLIYFKFKYYSISRYLFMFLTFFDLVFFGFVEIIKLTWTCLVKSKNMHFIKFRKFI